MNKAIAVLQRRLMSRWLQLASVLAMGIFLRGLQLAEIPNGYFHDEAWSDAKAMALTNGTGQPQVYFAENNGMDALPVYLIALLFKFTGPLAVGSRIVSALAGGLAILATYWVAWELFADSHYRHALGLIASFVMATLFWALTTSRSGWHVMSMTLIIAISLAALVRGRRLQRRRWFVLSGILAGLAQYTYPSARFLAALLLILFLTDVWHQRDRWRVVVADYASLAIAAAIVFAPLGYYFVQNPEWFFTRAQQVSHFDFADLLQNIAKTLAGFSLAGDTEGLHNLPGRPALDPILSVFFMSGLLVCIARRRFAHGMLLSWLIVFSLPAALTGQAP
ncbi:MAG TPA: glycosyltransferase family 39 protein, partial [Anaerolineae bacterium]